MIKLKIPNKFKKKVLSLIRPYNDGVARGTRTHDNQIHNLALYRLNYSHHVATRTIANLLNEVYANVGLLFGRSFFLLETSSRKIF